MLRICGDIFIHCLYVHSCSLYTPDTHATKHCINPHTSHSCILLYHLCEINPSRARTNTAAVLCTVLVKQRIQNPWRETCHTAKEITLFANIRLSFKPKFTRQVRKAYGQQIWVITQETKTLVLAGSP